MTDGTQRASPAPLSGTRPEPEDATFDERPGTPATAGGFRWILALLGVALLLGATLMPVAWYDALPRRPEVPQPRLKGVDLLRLSMLVEGVVLLVLTVTGWRFRRVANVARLHIPDAAPADDGLARRAAVGALAAITLLALGLRLLGIGSDLWLDEIAPVLLYRPMPAWQVLFTYLAPNNHLLNTLLTKVAISLFGNVEWAIRLPASLFGVATVPVLYWVGRRCLSRSASLGAALLLAVSYHHIFFSQNARGYSAYLLFSLLACALFVRGLQEDRLDIWTAYVLVVVLDVAALLNTAFVVAGHVLVGAVALAVMRRRGQPISPMARRLAIVFAVTGFLAFQLYATALPEMLATVDATYGRGRGGAALYSLEFIRELIQGVAVGFGSGLLLAALPFLALGGMGFLSLLRRHWPLTLSLIAPPVITAVCVIARGYGNSPRLFLLGLPLAILCAVEGLHVALARVLRATKRERLGAPRLASALVLVLAAVSLMALPRYYRVPKQPYRQALRYLRETRREGDGVVAVHLAEKGMRYYRDREGTAGDPSWTFARTPEVMDSAVAARGANRTRLVTTFQRALRRGAPALYSRVMSGWTPERVFPATVGDGAIVVWAPKAP